MLKLPDISEMLCKSSIKDVSDFYAFKNGSSYDQEQYLKIAKQINIDPELLQTYNNWLNINNKYFYFKSNYAFQELLIESIFKEIKVNTVEHQIVKFDEEIGLISANYRNSKLEYQYFDELTIGLNTDSFIEINNLLKKSMNREDYKKCIEQIFKIISVDILFGQYDRWEYNIFFEKSKNHIQLSPMFDNGCIFSEDYGDISIYKSCFGIFSISEKYEDYFTTKVIRKFPKLFLSLEQAINFELSKIFDNLEVEYKIKICKEIRTQIQNYYDKHRKMVEKTLKFVK